MKRFFSHIISKNYVSHKNIVPELFFFFYQNILSRGYPTKLKNYGNSRVWGGRGVRQTPPGMEMPGGRGLKKSVLRGSLDMFLGLHNWVAMPVD